MTTLEVSRIVPQTFKTIQVVDASAADIYTWLRVGNVGGAFSYNVSDYNDHGVSGSLVAIRSGNGLPDLFAYPDYWIFYSTDLTSIAVFDPAAAVAAIQSTNPDEALVWDASAPVVAVADGGAASVQFAQPSSLNGPFSYVVNVDGTAAAAGTPALSNVVAVGSGDPGLVRGATVSIALTDALAVGSHSVEVVCTSSNGKSATSAPATVAVEAPSGS